MFHHLRKHASHHAKGIVMAHPKIAAGLGLVGVVAIVEMATKKSTTNTPATSTPPASTTAVNS